MAEKKKAPAAKRKSTRFKPEASDMLALVNGQLPALVFSEAYRGCGLAMIEDFAPIKNAQVSVKIGAQPELKGKVVWKEQAGDNLVRLGIEFTE